MSTARDMRKKKIKCFLAMKLLLSFLWRINGSSSTLMTLILTAEASGPSMVDSNFSRDGPAHGSLSKMSLNAVDFICSLQTQTKSEASRAYTTPWNVLENWKKNNTNWRIFQSIRKCHKSRIALWIVSSHPLLAKI